MPNYITLFLKGIAMGAANVIPGVSGGTIAFITGIYEEFIESLKSFDLTALKLASSFKVKELIEHLNLAFLIPLFLGMAVSLVSLGKGLDWLFVNHPTFVWSFFFGLILASVFYVSKNIKQRSASTIISFVAGLAIALALAFIKPAEQNDSLLYISICGVVAICSMILPGLSGSFVLILMGNYQLIMLQAIPNFNLRIMIPFALGAGIGFIALSHLISYLMRLFQDATLSLLTGFIFGSLAIIWPWKNEVFLKDNSGELILKKGEKIVQGYDWHVPAFDTSTTYIALALILAGVVSVALLEKTAAKT